MAQGKFKLKQTKEKNKVNRGKIRVDKSKNKSSAKTTKQKILKSLKVSAEQGLISKIPHSERNRLHVMRPQ